MGLFDAFKQYLQDAAPGGVLNPEIPKDTPILGLLGDPMGSIRSTLNKANAQADKHLKLLEAATNESKRTGKLNSGPATTALNNELGNWVLNTFGPLQTVWHGSPHKFDRFDFSKIGTGEGAQAYGHGGYLAEAQGVGQGYADALAHKSNASLVQRGRNSYDVIAPDGTKIVEDAWLGKASKAKEAFDAEQKGYLYKVDLPDEHIAKMLDWDKPLSQQPAAIQQWLKDPYNAYRHKLTAPDVGGNEPTGGLVMNRLQELMAEGKRADAFSNSANYGAANASRELLDAGIPGIRYLDGGSRGTGAGTSNFVVFPGNEGLLTILERNGQALNPGLLKP